MKFKDYFRLAIDGKWLTRFFTILLSGIAFACFALASISFTNNEYDVYVNAMLSNKKDYFSVLQMGEGDLNEQTLGQDVINVFEDIEEIQNGDGYLYCYQYAFYDSKNSFFPSLNKYIFPDVILSDEELDMYYEAWNSSAICGNFENYEEFFTVLAGRYPENKSEIAISDLQYDYFKRCGYCDATDAFYHDKRGNIEVDESMAGEVYEINDYADIIGKQVNYNDETFSKVTIVGVIETEYDYDSEDSFSGYPSSYIEGKIFLSEEWREQLRGNDDRCTGMFAKKTASRSLAKKLVDATLEAQKLVFVRHGEGADGIEWQRIPAGIHPLYRLYGKITVQQNVILLLDGIAIVFGIFGFVLNFYLIGASIKRKERKIGILRALGASDKLVTKIFLTEALLMAVLIFVFALIVTVCGYYFILEDLFFYESDYIAVQLLSFKFVNYLILAACCFVIPLLAALIPIKRFFKKPIVSNIRNN